METFGYELADTARIMRRDFDRRAAALGVTRSQWRVLSLLSRKDGARQVELAEALDLEPITLGRQIDRLAEAKLVERRADDRDRRAWNIHLTAAAQPLIDKLQALGAEFYDDALDGIGDEEKAIAARVMARVRDNLNRTAPQHAVRRAS